MPICLSERVEELAHVCKGRKELSLKEVVGLIGPKAQALVSLVLSLPFVVLLPAPGLSILFGVIILINGISIARGKMLWIPQKLAGKIVSGDALAKNLLKTIPFLKWVEKFVRPRGTVYQQGHLIQLVNGSFLALGGFFLFLPLPPGTNFLPGLAIFFVSLGILESDLAMLWIGYIFALINLVIYIVIPLILME